jgi:hypothetical protein
MGLGEHYSVRAGCAWLIRYDGWFWSPQWHCLYRGRSRGRYRASGSERGRYRGQSPRPLPHQRSECGLVAASAAILAGSEVSGHD